MTRKIRNWSSFFISPNPLKPAKNAGLRACYLLLHSGPPDVNNIWHLHYNRKKHHHSSPFHTHTRGIFYLYYNVFFIVCPTLKISKNIFLSRKISNFIELHFFQLTALCKCNQFHVLCGRTGIVSNSIYFCKLFSVLPASAECSRNTNRSKYRIDTV